MNNKLFYKKNGTGIPLILIHGFTGSHESFETSVRYLRQYFKVITIDMIGHGDSLHPYRYEWYVFMCWSYNLCIKGFSSMRSSSLGDFEMRCRRCIFPK